MLEIKTTTLQDMVSKASKCVSNNKLIPLTSLMSIKVKNNTLLLTTTDATNYFYIKSTEKAECEDFEVSVLADLFIKLVQKTTSDTISISLETNALKIKGNGDYTLEILPDENGNPIKFPVKYNSDDFRNDLGIIKLSTVNKIINYNKPSLAVSVELPSLTSYYCGDKVVTSDSYKICSTGVKVFDKPMLISARLMDILSIMSDEDIRITSSEKDILFSTDNEIVYSPIVEGIDTYPIKPITQLIESDFPSTCKISRTAVVDLLDRLALFVSPYDKKGINLTFTKDGVMFSSKKSSGVELVPYITSENFAEYSCCVDVELLKSQIATQDGESIELSYGSKIAIKMTTNDIIQIVALMSEV